MIKQIPFLLILLGLTACSIKQTGNPKNESSIDHQYLQRVQQLTHDGDNGEAYFSWDNQNLIFQSNQGGYECDKIWTMDLDGSNKKMISPNIGAHTCSFYFPGKKEVVFASTR